MPGWYDTNTLATLPNGKNGAGENSTDNSVIQCGAE
jgi:hypothetical protein